MKLIFYLVAFASISVLGWQVSCNGYDPLQQLMLEILVETSKDPDFNKWAWSTSLNSGTEEAILIGFLSHMPKHLLAVLDEKLTEEMKPRFVNMLLNGLYKRWDLIKSEGQGPVQFGFGANFKTDL